MITLYQGPRAWGSPNMSPFCIKLEAWLRMNGVEYEQRLADFRQAPKGKIPWIVHDGKVIGDSELIVDYLKQQLGEGVDARLTGEQRASGHAVRRMLEEGLYFCGVYARWMEPDSFAEVRRVLFDPMPFPVRLIVPGVALRQVRRNLWGQGTGRHKPDEIYELARRDLSALATILGDQQYLFGDEPVSYDATAFALLSAALRFPRDTRLKAIARSFPSLVAYHDRFHQKYFADITA